MMFNFEFDFAGRLQCIPMVVRFNLDRCGIKLSLKQWNRFTHRERVRLIEQLCGAADDVREYRNLLIELIRDHTGERAEEIAVEERPAWDDVTQVPPRLEAYARDLGMAPPRLPVWRELSPLQRFALFKLTRPGHRNENFGPAMEEFGLAAHQMRLASGRQDTKVT